MVHIFERMHVNKFPLEGEKEKKEKERGGEKGVGSGIEDEKGRRGLVFSFCTFAKSWPIAEHHVGSPSVFPCRAQVSGNTVASVRGN